MFLSDLPPSSKLSVGSICLRPPSLCFPMPDGNWGFLIHPIPSMDESTLRNSCASSEESQETPVRRNEQQEKGSSLPPPPPTPTSQPLSLVHPSQKKKHRTKVFRVFRSVFRSLPIITPACKMPVLNGGLLDSSVLATRVTGTLFGYRKGRVSLSLQENPRCFPSVVVELAMQTNVLQKEMGAGMVRIALECEKRGDKDKTRVLEEPLWTMYCNGKKVGYAVKREATAEDLNVMELLKAVSMGAGVLPGSSQTEGQDTELAYIRAHFEHVVGSKDSETFYMISPDGDSGPELSIFMVRI